MAATGAMKPESRTPPARGTAALELEGLADWLAFVLEAALLAGLLALAGEGIELDATDGREGAEEAGGAGAPGVPEVPAIWAATEALNEPDMLPSVNLAEKLSTKAFGLFGSRVTSDVKRMK